MSRYVFDLTDPYAEVHELPLGIPLPSERVPQSDAARAFASIASRSSKNTGGSAQSRSSAAAAGASSFTERFPLSEHAARASLAHTHAHAQQILQHPQSAPPQQSSNPLFPNARSVGAALQRLPLIEDEPGLGRPMLGAVNAAHGRAAAAVAVGAPTFGAAQVSDSTLVSAWFRATVSRPMPGTAGFHADQEAFRMAQLLRMENVMLRTALFAERGSLRALTAVAATRHSVEFPPGHETDTVSRLYRTAGRGRDDDAYATVARHVQRFVGEMAGVVVAAAASASSGAVQALTAQKQHAQAGSGFNGTVPVPSTASAGSGDSAETCISLDDDDARASAVYVGPDGEPNSPLSGVEGGRQPRRAATLANKRISQMVEAEAALPAPGGYSRAASGGLGGIGNGNGAGHNGQQQPYAQNSLRSYNPWPDIGLCPKYSYADFVRTLKDACALCPVYRQVVGDTAPNGWPRDVVYTTNVIWAVPPTFERMRTSFPFPPDPRLPDLEMLLVSRNTPHMPMVNCDAVTMCKKCYDRNLGPQLRHQANTSVRGIYGPDHGHDCDARAVAAARLINERVKRRYGGDADLDGSSSGGDNNGGASNSDSEIEVGDDDSNGDEDDNDDGDSFSKKSGGRDGDARRGTLEKDAVGTFFNGGRAARAEAERRILQFRREVPSQSDVARSARSLASGETEKESARKRKDQYALVRVACMLNGEPVSTPSLVAPIRLRRPRQGNVPAAYYTSKDYFEIKVLDPTSGHPAAQPTAEVSVQRGLFARVDIGGHDPDGLEYLADNGKVSRLGLHLMDYTGIMRIDTGGRSGQYLFTYSEVSSNNPRGEFDRNTTHHTMFLIDAQYAGNESRFINGSKGTGREPNCEFAYYRCPASGEMRVGIFLLRRIAAGDELLLDYGKKYCFESGLHDDQPSPIAPSRGRLPKPRSGGRDDSYRYSKSSASPRSSSPLSNSPRSNSPSAGPHAHSSSSSGSSSSSSSSSSAANARTAAANAAAAATAAAEQAKLSAHSPSAVLAAAAAAKAARAAAKAAAAADEVDAQHGSGRGGRRRAHDAITLSDSSTESDSESHGGNNGRNRNARAKRAGAGSRANDRDAARGAEILSDSQSETVSEVDSDSNNNSKKPCDSGSGRSKAGSETESDFAGDREQASESDTGSTLLTEIESESDGARSGRGRVVRGGAVRGGAVRGGAIRGGAIRGGAIGGRGRGRGRAVAADRGGSERGGKHMGDDDDESGDKDASGSGSGRDEEDEAGNSRTGSGSGSGSGSETESDLEPVRGPASRVAAAKAKAQAKAEATAAVIAKRIATRAVSSQKQVETQRARFQANGFVFTGTGKSSSGRSQHNTRGESAKSAGKRKGKDADSETESESESEKRSQSQSQSQSRSRPQARSQSRTLSQISVEVGDSESESLEAEFVFKRKRMGVNYRD